MGALSSAETTARSRKRRLKQPKTAARIAKRARKRKKQTKRKDCKARHSTILRLFVPFSSFLWLLQLLCGGGGQEKGKKKPEKVHFGYFFGYLFRKTLIIKVYCGERGIRTPGTSQYAGFQDRCIRPLCHLSNSVG